MMSKLPIKTQEHPNQHICYECAMWQDDNIMQKYDCAVCGRRKCLNHGGGSDSTCGVCKTENVCVDCAAFAECCRNIEPATTLEQLKDENRVLKLDIEKLTTENNMLRDCVKAVQHVALLAGKVISEHAQ